jgi:ubiquinone/menaquinone biosynthesis C-methylase UbiE
LPTYDRIGKSYDSTRRADPFILGRLLYHLNSKPGEKILDVACGTGNYTIALAQSGLTMHGIDQSSVMIEKACKKSDRVRWHLGDAEQMPFTDKSFTGALCTLAIHHFKDMRPIFAEVHRVLEQGRFVIFTADPDPMKKSWLNNYFPEMMTKSAERIPRKEVVTKNLIDVGFAIISTERFYVTETLQDLFLFAGKHRPALYLDPQVRAGISSFAEIATIEEVERGLAHLARDIDSGKIRDVIASDPNESEYLFIVAQK